MSDKFLQKFITDTFRVGDISKRGWFRIWFWALVDSREKKKKRLEEYVHDQLLRGKIDIVKKGLEFLDKYPNSDVRIVEICKWVKQNFQYVSDEVNYGSPEVWADINAVWDSRKDDCDGLNTLVYCLALYSGISELKLWNVVDYLKLGHYYLLYFSFKTDKWYAIDATYYPDTRPLSLRSQFADNPYYKGKTHIDFLFNSLGTFKQKII